MIELSHIYLRTNAQNVNFFDVYDVLKLKNMQFNTSRLRDPGVYNTVKSLTFLPVNQEQESKMVTNLH